MAFLVPLVTGLAGGVYGAYMGGRAVANVAQNEVAKMRGEIVGAANPAGAELVRGAVNELANNRAFSEKTNEMAYNAGENFALGFSNKMIERANANSGTVINTVNQIAYDAGENFGRAFGNEMIERANANSEAFVGTMNAVAYEVGENLVQGACDRLGKILLSTIVGILVGIAIDAVLGLLLPLVLSNMPFIICCFIFWLLVIAYGYILPYKLRKHSNTIPTWIFFYIAKFALLANIIPIPALFWTLFIYSVFVDFLFVKVLS